MADIRIKDLATTAASTASDDFLAVDGSANGTRKLNAFSPTFGGNVVATGTLTVNSTTDSSSKDTGAIVTEGGLGVEKSATIGGNLTVSGTGGITSSNASGGALIVEKTGTGAIKGQYYSGSNVLGLYDATNLRVPWEYNGSTNVLTLSAGSATVSGNLTVSGTGTSSFAGRLFGINTNSPDDFGASYSTLQINAVSTGGGAYSVFKNVADSVNFRVGADGLGVINVVSNHPLLFNTNNIERARIFASGNFGIGTGSTDGGQKLQVNGSVNVFGGGTLTVTNAANTANIIRSSDSSGNAVDAVFKATGTTYAVQTTDTSGNLQTALTLDSSQRCILAGALRLNNAYVAGAPTATGYVTIQDSAGNTYKVLVGT